jgi:hypothetical protein
LIVNRIAGQVRVMGKSRLPGRLKERRKLLISLPRIAELPELQVYPSLAGR